jgi:hypothetical protein
MQGQGSGVGTAPDWYPDPAGRHEFRYWDGASWTQNVADGGAQSVDPLGAKKPRRNRRMGLLIVGLFVVVWGAFVAVSAATMREPVVPQGTPPQVLSMKVMDDPSGLSAGGLIAYQSDPYTFGVSFTEKDVEADEEDTGTPFLKSIDGDWYGSKAYVSVDGHDRGTAEPDTTGKDWSDTIADDAEQVLSPTLHASLPIRASDVGSITVAAGMTVTLPYDYSGGFAEASAGVERRATFFVVSPAQMELRRNLDDWNGRSSLLLGGAIILGIGVVLSVWGVIRQRKAARLDAR